MKPAGKLRYRPKPPLSVPFCEGDITKRRDPILNNKFYNKHTHYQWLIHPLTWIEFNCFSVMHSVFFRFEWWTNLKPWNVFSTLNCSIHNTHLSPHILPSDCLYQFWPHEWTNLKSDIEFMTGIEWSTGFFTVFRHYFLSLTKWI